MEAVAVLGLNGGVPCGLAFVDDTDVQFVSGRCIVRYDTETKQQNILHASISAAAITALAISPNRRNVAFAERSQDGNASVFIFDWSNKRRRRLTSIDNAYTEVVYLSFTADGKTLFVQGSAPESSMRMILWEKGAGGKVTGTIHCVPPAPGRHVAALHACPADSNIVAACGRGFLRMYRFLDGAFKTLAVNLRKDPSSITTDFTCQLWLGGEDWQVAGCSAGDLYLLRGGELVRMLDPPPEAGPGIMVGSGGIRPIACLAEYGKGFMAGCAGGVVRLYERAETGAHYQCTRSILLQDPSPVTCLALSPTEEECVALTGRGQAYAVKVTAVELARQNIEEVAAANTRALVGPLHMMPSVADAAGGSSTQTSAAAVLAAATGKRQGYQDIPLAEQGITGLSLCLRKPMFVTCGADKSVRVWNYTGAHLGLAGLSLAHGEVAGVGGMEGPGAHAVTTPALELVQYMEEIPSSVAIHPSGNLIAVGLATTLRLCTLVLGHNPPCLRSLKDYPIWQASDVVFSHGGGLLAAAAGTTITVLSPWTGASAAVLRGHTDRVVALAWSRDDKCLVSTGREGSTIRWAIAVPNAAPGGGSGVAALSIIAGGPVPLPALSLAEGGAAAAPHTPHAARGGSASAASALIPAPALVGTIVGRVDVKDFCPLALVLGAAESGRDAIVSGVVFSSPAGGVGGALAGVKGLTGAAGGGQGTYVAVTRHLVLDAASLSLSSSSSSHHPKEGGGVRIAVVDTKAAPAAAEGGAGGALPEGSEEGVKESTRAMALLHATKVLVAGLGRRVADPSPAAAAKSGAEGEGTEQPPSTGGGGSEPPVSSGGGPGSPPRGGARSHAGGAAAGSPPARASSPDRAEGGGGRGHDSSSSTGLLRLSRLPAAGPHPHSTHAQGDHASKAGAGGRAGGGGLGEVVYHAAPLLRMAVSRDERLLITAASDGSIALWSVKDASLGERTAAGGAGSGSASTSSSSTAAGAAGGASVDRLQPADTILAAKADMDLLKRERTQLESKIADVSVTNRKSEALKLASNESRVGELQAKFDGEVEGARAKTAELLHAKARMEQQAEGQIASLAASQARELAETETSYSAKLVAEMGRYDKLVMERDSAAVEARQAAQALAAKQALQIEELRAKYEAQIAEEEAAVAALEAERASIAAASVRAAHGLEADAEGEMANLRTRYEMRLAAESKATLLLRGENGFMKRKFVGINREIGEQKEEMTALNEKEKELQDAIANLTKDVAGHKKEIREREETISDKDTRIYELKKKNQELEKFKFVLNYKIQELKRQIMPKKKEISDMREQLKEMEMELLQYHKSNAALDLMIGELKLKRDGIRRDVAAVDEAVLSVDDAMGRMARDLLAVAGAGKSHPQPGSAAALKAVRSSMLQLYAKYIHGEGSGMKSAMAALGASLQAESKEGGPVAVPPGVNVEELAEELARQRHHLEKNVESVQRKIAMDVRACGTDRARLLRENTALTREVNDLRRDLRFLKADVAQVKQAAETERDASRRSGAGTASLTSAAAAGGAATARGSSAHVLRRTGALQGIVSQGAAGGSISQPLGIVVSVSKTLAP